MINAFGIEHVISKSSQNSKVKRARAESTYQELSRRKGKSINLRPVPVDSVKEAQKQYINRSITKPHTKDNSESATKIKQIRATNKFALNNSNPRAEASNALSTAAHRRKKFAEGRKTWAKGNAKLYSQGPNRIADKFEPAHQEWLGQRFDKKATPVQEQSKLRSGIKAVQEGQEKARSYKAKHAGTIKSIRHLTQASKIIGPRLP